MSVESYLQNPSFGKLEQLIGNLKGSDLKILVTGTLDSKNSKKFSNTEKGLIFYVHDRLLEAEYFFGKSYKENKDLRSLTYLFLVNIDRHNINNASNFLSLLEKREKKREILCSHKIIFCLVTNNLDPLSFLCSMLVNSNFRDYRTTTVLMQGILRLNDCSMLLKLISTSPRSVEFVSKQQKNRIIKMIRLHFIQMMRLREHADV